MGYMGFAIKWKNTFKNALGTFIPFFTRSPFKKKTPKFQNWINNKNFQNLRRYLPTNNSKKHMGGVN